MTLRGELLSYLPYFLVSFVISVLMVPVFRGVSFRVGALDKGGGRRVHKGVIPRLGGGGIFLAFLLPAAYWIFASGGAEKLLVIISASVIVFAIGVYDDIKGARVRNKLIAEVFGALLLYHFGVRIDKLGGINGTFDLGWLSLPVTVLWILIVTNAVNLIDGLDGLAAGTGILTAITLLLVSGLGPGIGLACTLLTGSLAGFLIYNFPPASVFMGDSGSLFTGFILASLSAASSAKASTLAALMVPILAFGLPLTDMLYAVLRRYYRGVPLGQADKEHIHHKLLEKGLSRKKVLFVIYSLNAIIMLLCLVMVGKHRLLSLSALAALPLAVVLGLRIFGYIEFIPFAKELYKNFEKSRKGRYYSYLIKRFRRDAAAADSFDSLRAAIMGLMELDDLGKVEIILERHAGWERGGPFLLYAGGAVNSKRPLTISLPVIREDGNAVQAHAGGNLRAPGGQVIGLVRMTGSAEGDFTLYCADIAQAISEEISGFAARKSQAPVYIKNTGEAIGPLSV